MTHTVIGFFRNTSDAYDAVDALRREGFDSGNIDVSSESGSSVSRDDDREERSGKIGNFFKSLFGDNDDDTYRYSQAARENTLVTVHASSVSEAERAADVLDSKGAIDINEPVSGTYTGSDFGQSRSEFGSDRTNTGADFDQTRFSSDRDSDFVAGAGPLSADRDPGRAGFDMDDDDDLSLRSDRTGFTSGKDYDSTDETSIPIIEEDVNVGKREVRRGGVRVRSRIVEKPVEETLRLREERIHVERNPVDRDVTGDTDFKEETIEVEAFGEEPLVSKRKRIVEEVKVGKKIHERSETVRDTKRKTEVDIEHDNPDDDLSGNRGFNDDRDFDPDKDRI